MRNLTTSEMELVGGGLGNISIGDITAGNGLSAGNGNAIASGNDVTVSGNGSDNSVSATVDAVVKAALSIL